MNLTQLFEPLNSRMLLAATLLLGGSLWAYWKGRKVHLLYWADRKNVKNEDAHIHGGKFMGAYFPYICVYFMLGIGSIVFFFNEIRKIIPQEIKQNIIAMIVFGGIGLLLIPLKKNSHHSFRAYFAWFFFILGIGFLFLEIKLFFHL